jgi:DNA-binding MarR family transcriptional regulator
MQQPQRRPHSRRGDKLRYRRERWISGRKLCDLDPDDPAAIAIEQLRRGGALLSALRRAARDSRIDWRIARLVLLLRPDHRSNLVDVAWDLGVTQATASNLCDRAEEQAIVDKWYDNDFDRRTTSVRLTATGRELRAQIEVMLRTTIDPKRPRPWVYGRRAYIEANGSCLDDL